MEVGGKRTTPREGFEPRAILLWGLCQNANISLDIIAIFHFVYLHFRCKNYIACISFSPQVRQLFDSVEWCWWNVAGSAGLVAQFSSQCRKRRQILESSESQRGPEVFSWIQSLKHPWTCPSVPQMCICPGSSLHLTSWQQRKFHSSFLIAIFPPKNRHFNRESALCLRRCLLRLILLWESL